MASQTETTAAKERRRKLANGEGGYRERPNGLWECRISLPNGKRKSIYGKSFEECRDNRRQAEREQERGLDLSAKRQTVEAFLAAWLEETAKPTLRPKTHHSYAQLIRLHIVPALGKTELAKLTPHQVQAMMAAMTTKGLSPRSVQYTRAVLRRALGHALKWELVSRNVATLVDPPRSVRKPVHALTADQARGFLDGVRAADDRLWPLYTAAVLTGLRQAELLGLRWTDLDLTSGTLRVAHTLQRVSGEWSFVEPKTKRSARALSLPAVVVSAFQVQKDRQAFERKAAGAAWIDRGLVFTTPKGTPLEPSNLSKRLHASLEAAGLPKQGMHALRHCCASLLLAQGVSARVVMEQLGHSQISLTMDTYSHVMPAMLREAANALDKAFENAKTG
ncbi:MAG: site-specific integrase [Thermomicrobiales bacterium]